MKEVLEGTFTDLDLNSILLLVICCEKGKRQIISLVHVFSLLCFFFFCSNLILYVLGWFLYHFVMKKDQSKLELEFPRIPWASLVHLENNP